ncbi:methyltransferase [Segetibacter sp. 3557_3]|uniref:DUF6250 domain-containing protein n=1 Tax=Segetibacter sp. 3557_3 TaxID=2547429 RepID=UPI001058EA87|nr:DUF6250 domain-containing protein [Segetibacter sp. 3557_3]TDH25639.1 methyltransferase [Segetibacter sp. 3557_3]
MMTHLSLWSAIRLHRLRAMGKNVQSMLLSAAMLVCGAVTNISPVNAQLKAKQRLVYSDNFSKDLDTSKWQVEIAPVGNSSVYTRKGRLVLDTKGGVTVWFKHQLTGNNRIEFTRTVLVDTGINDRLSDLNMFWMATDPRNDREIRRDGVLESYDSLRLYYLGMGGNSNSTTRFRKYEGNGQRTLLQEYTNREHLLEPNKQYHVVISVKCKQIQVIVNGKMIVDYTDEKPLRSGYFGFRSTKSRQAIDNFKVHHLR